MQHVLEGLMLIFFSISWYWSIARMLMTGVAAGKSPSFVALICAGYTFGIFAKLALWKDTGALPPITWLYGWNLVVTLFDLWLVVHLTRGRGAPRSAGA